MLLDLGFNQYCVYEEIMQIMAERLFHLWKCMHYSNQDVKGFGIGKMMHNLSVHCRSTYWQEDANFLGICYLSNMF